MQLNHQALEKRVHLDSGALEVHSVFSTIQGEGPFTGRRAIFVRLAGCNLMCPGCDTDYTSKRETYEAEHLARLVNALAGAPGYLVVITGGEPFRQNISPFVAALLSEGYTVQVETNGTLAPPTLSFYEMCSLDTSERNKCFVVCSPKTGKLNASLVPVICAYKYVLAENSVGNDGLPLLALGHTAAPYIARPPYTFRGPVYLQPCDEGNWVPNAANLKACIASVLEHGYTLQLQIHKLVNME